MKKFVAVLCLVIVSMTCLAVLDNRIGDRYEIEMAEIGEPGTLVVKIWCYSKKPYVKEDVVKKNAIKGVLFTGISDSGRIKGRKALVDNGYENHKDYFDNFFNEGKYLQYSRLPLETYVESNSLIKVGRQYKIGHIVVIQYDELRKQLEADNIIKGLDYGF